MGVGEWGSGGVGVWGRLGDWALEDRSESIYYSLSTLRLYFGCRSAQVAQCKLSTIHYSLKYSNNTGDTSDRV